MRRHIYRMRIRFHDWMWSGGKGVGTVRRLCRRLPFYFSDPHMPSRREMERLDTLPRVEIRTPSGGLRVVQMDQSTGTFSGGDSFTYYVWP